MNVALSEMSRDALVTQLRLAYVARNIPRVAQIKRLLAKRNRRKMPYGTYGFVRAPNEKDA